MALIVLVLALGGWTPVASAAPIGGLVVVPGESSDLAAIRIRTTAGCPAQADAYYARISGQGFPAEGQVVTANTSAGLSHTAGFDVYFALTMKDFAADANAVLSGRYDITVHCIDSFTQNSFGEFTGSLQFNSPTSYEALGTAKPAGPPPPALPLSGGGPAAGQPPAPGEPTVTAHADDQAPAAVGAAPADSSLLRTALLVLAGAVPVAAVLALIARRRRTTDERTN